MDPWFNVTARLWVRSTSSDQAEDDVYKVDEFLVSIVEKCRMVSLNAAMDVQVGGSGTSSSHYTIDLWQRLDMTLVMSTYNTYSSPNSLNRCTVTTTLHYNNYDRTEVTSS